MPNYLIEVHRNVCQSGHVTVEAENEDEARDKAMGQIYKGTFHIEDDEVREANIEHVEEVNSKEETV